MNLNLVRNLLCCLSFLLLGCSGKQVDTSSPSFVASSSTNTTNGISALVGFDGLPANPSPTSIKPIIPSTDKIGETFRAFYNERVYQNQPTSNYKPYGTIKVSWLDLDTLQIETRAGQVKTYKLSGSAPDGDQIFTDTANGNRSVSIGFDTTGHIFSGNFNQFAGPSGNSLALARFQGGFTTDPQNLPFPNATYMGLGRANGHLNILGQINTEQSFRGTTLLNADFANGRIFGDIIAGNRIKISMTDGVIRGANIFANNSLELQIRNSPFDTYTNTLNHSGDTAGQFSGANGTVLFGSFGGTFTATKTPAPSTWVDGADYEYRGSFSAMKL